MKKVLSIFFVVFFVINIAAQTSGTDTRFARQHMKQTIEMLIQSLNGGNPNFQSSAAQTIRQLEEIYPDLTFHEFVDPLSKIVKNENADTQVRILSAITLEELHSDEGDEAIEFVANSSTNKSVRDLCSALLVKVRN